MFADQNSLKTAENVCMCMYKTNVTNKWRILYILLKNTKYNTVITKQLQVITSHIKSKLGSLRGSEAYAHLMHNLLNKIAWK